MRGGGLRVQHKIKDMRYGIILFFLLMALVFSPPPSRAEQAPAKYLVVIDPAHGGADRGVELSGKESEKDITLKIALALQKELQIDRNVRVQLTRTSDVAMSIAERIKIIRASGAGVFISLHINAGFGKKATGYEVYFPGFKAAASNKNSASEIVSDMAKNKHLNDSVALAQVMRRNLQNVFPRKDRDLRDAPIALLEGLSLPAVVVEIGFATNLEDKKTLVDENGRKMIAQALGKSIKEFLRLN